MNFQLRLFFLLIVVGLASSLPTALPAAGQSGLLEPEELKERLDKLELENLQLRRELDLLREKVGVLLGPNVDTRIYRVPKGDSPIRGNPEAPLTLVEFGDFQSDYTARALHVVKRLLEDFPDSLHFIFKHFPLNSIHPQANEAALAALAAEKQGLTWEMHDLILQNTRKLEPNLYLLLAQQLDLDLAKFDQDRRALWALERLANDEKAGVKSEVSGVPMFFLNGRRLPSWRYDYIKGQVEKLLEELKEQKKGKK